MNNLLYREVDGKPEHYCRVDWAAGLAEDCAWPHTIRMPYRRKTQHADAEISIPVVFVAQDVVDVLGINKDTQHEH